MFIKLILQLPYTTKNTDTTEEFHGLYLTNQQQQHNKEQQHQTGNNPDVHQLVKRSRKDQISIQWNIVKRNEVLMACYNIDEIVLRKISK